MRKFFRRLFRKTTDALLEQIAHLEKQLAEAKNEIEELRKPDIRIDLQDDSEFPCKPKSVRINYYTWRDWQEFCDKNEEHPKKQLISMALKEFMEKHQ